MPREIVSGMKNLGLTLIIMGLCLPIALFPLAIDSDILRISRAGAMPTLIALLYRGHVGVISYNQIVTAGIVIFFLGIWVMLPARDEDSNPK